MELDLFPETRYMGSKKKLLPSLKNVFERFKFESVLDPFSGSASVSYLLKTMGKKVVSNDYLRFNYHIAHGIIENNEYTISDREIEDLLPINKDADDFIEKTFCDIYYSKQECKWLDSAIYNIQFLKNEYKKSIALAALCRACLKKRPRGIFTYTGMRYDDGRKDLRKTIEQQYKDAIKMYNSCVFDGKKRCESQNKDIFQLTTKTVDMVYLDPPYFSTKSDNEYSRRYHFLEGLVSYWKHVKIDYSTKTLKFKRPYSKFNHRHLIVDAFDDLFNKYTKSHIVLSYSSNSFPDPQTIKGLFRNNGKSTELVKINYTYSVGTHSHLKNNSSNEVNEYIFLGV